jgi:integrase
VAFPSSSGDMPIIGYPKMWRRIAKLGDLPADITPHVLRDSFASLVADLGYNEPTAANLLGHKTHSITSRYAIPPTSCWRQQPTPWRMPPSRRWRRIKRNPSCGIGSEMDSVVRDRIAS